MYALIANVLSWFRRRAPKAPGVGERAARGRWGEDRAADYLQREKGYSLVARNWRHGRDELDLVCRDGPVLVFVEVRTRDASALVGGFDSLTARKRAAFRRASRAYLKGLRPKPPHFRWDVIEISVAADAQFEIRHFENVRLD